MVFLDFHGRVLQSSSDTGYYYNKRFSDKPNFKAYCNLYLLLRMRRAVFVKWLECCCCVSWHLLNYLVRSKFGLSSYDDKIRVTTVFGTGRATTTDSPGLIGEINTPIDTVYSVDENYLYITDQNGGGLIRKLVVTSEGVAASSLQLYGVKTVFAGRELQYHPICILITFIRCQLQLLPIPGQE